VLPCPKGIYFTFYGNFDLNTIAFSCSNDLAKGTTVATPFSVATQFNFSSSFHVHVEPHSVVTLTGRVNGLVRLQSVISVSDSICILPPTVYAVALNRSIVLSHTSQERHILRTPYHPRHNLCHIPVTSIRRCYGGLTPA